MDAGDIVLTTYAIGMVLGMAYFVTYMMTDGRSGVVHRALIWKIKTLGRGRHGHR